MYRRYCSELHQALGSEVAQFRNGTPAAKQDSGPKGLPRATAADLLSPVERAEVLLRSMERRLTSEDSAKPLVELCELLEARFGAAELVALIKNRIG